MFTACHPLLPAEARVALTLSGWADSPRTRSRALSWCPRPPSRNASSVRGDLLARLGRHSEARVKFERAAALAGNEREKALPMQRARALPGGV